MKFFTHRANWTAQLMGCILLFMALPALADGGVLVAQKQGPGFSVAVFSSPFPIEVGMADISVLVRDLKQQALLNCEVVLEPIPQGCAFGEPADRERGDNQLIYHSMMHFPISGKIQLVVDVKCGDGRMKLPLDLSIQEEPGPWQTYWKEFLLPALLIILFCLHQWLRGRRP
jgi:hypothetical protein